MDGDRSGEGLLRLPVRLHGIHVGHPVDVVLQPDARRVIGLEIRCGDESHRFLPLGAARVHDDAIEIESALLLLEGSNLAFYRSRGRSLRELRGVTVERSGRPAGAFLDVELDETGAVTQLVVAGDGGETRLPNDESVTLVAADAASAA